jgi:hypothetical protein
LAHSLLSCLQDFADPVQFAVPWRVKNSRRVKEYSRRVESKEVAGLAHSSLSCLQDSADPVQFAVPRRVKESKEVSGLVQMTPCLQDSADAIQLSV